MSTDLKATVPVLLVKEGPGDLLMSCDPHPSKTDRRTCLMQANEVFTALMRCSAFVNARNDHRAEIVEVVCGLITEGVKADRALWSRLDHEQTLLDALIAAEAALNKIRVCCHHTAWDATGPAVIAARAAIAAATGKGEAA